jgi:hypothetical protein
VTTATFTPRGETRLNVTGRTADWLTARWHRTVDVSGVERDELEAAVLQNELREVSRELAELLGEHAVREWSLNGYQNRGMARTGRGFLVQEELRVRVVLFTEAERKHLVAGRSPALLEGAL